MNAEELLILRSNDATRSAVFCQAAKTQLGEALESARVGVIGPNAKQAITHAIETIDFAISYAEASRKRLLRKADRQAEAHRKALAKDATTP